MPEELRSPPGRGGGIRIRAARASDLDGLELLEETAFVSDRLSRRRFAALMKSPTSHLLVAERDGALAGYALVLTRAGSRGARLYSLAVEPRLAGHGIGSQLLAAAEAAASAHGAEVMRLEVRSDNEEAIGLYESRGYARRGERPDYYADGMTALRYVRQLARPPVGKSRPLRRAA